MKLGQLSELKRGGRVSKAQQTTTKQSQITAAHQLIWYIAVDTLWVHMKNTYLPPDQLAIPMEHFQFNIYE